MRITLHHKKYINARFKTMNSIDDFLLLLNDTKEMMYGKEFHSIRKNELRYYANPKICHNRYSKFEIKKKSGGIRVINAPNDGLKTILKVLNVIFQHIYEPHKSSVGFTLGKSIVDGAQLHVGKNYIYNIDLKDFFHSFDQKRLKYALMKSPFNLRGEQREQIAYFISCLCTHPFEINGEIKNVLPQGSPTSPVITNFLCEKLDNRLNGLAKRFGCDYSRYADDISFSSNKNVFIDTVFLTELSRIIEENQKLEINGNKTRLLTKNGNNRQEVTGLTVNEKVNVRRNYTKELRMLIYYWETYGIEKAQKIYNLHSSIQSNRSKKSSSDVKNVIFGKLLYMKMVKGNNDSTYKALQDRFDKLAGGKIKIEKTNSPFTPKDERISLVRHDPKQLVKLLNMFGTDHEELKFTTHLWDGNEINSFEFFSKKNYDKHSKIEKIRDLDDNLWWEKIFPFVFQDKLKTNKKGEPFPYRWGKHQMRIGWNYPNFIKNWCANNYDNKGLKAIQPFNILLPDEFLPETKVIDKITIKTFLDVVNVFKKEIEFRGNDFYIAIQYLFANNLVGFELDKTALKSLKSFNVYTNTEKILNAIGRIFQMIKSVCDDMVAQGIHVSQRIHIQSSFHETEDEKYYTLEIIHVNSVCWKPYNHPKLSGKSGDLAKVVKDLIGRCDFSISGEFSDGHRRVFTKLDYLYPGFNQLNPEVKITTNVNDPGGFVYWFKFYV